MARGNISAWPTPRYIGIIVVKGIFRAQRATLRVGIIKSTVMSDNRAVSEIKRYHFKTHIVYAANIIAANEADE